MAIGIGSREVPDDRIYDAINVFKYSLVGRGTAYIGGDREYGDRYRRLARDVIAELWRLWAIDEITFADMAESVVGDSGYGREGPDIRVNRRIEPSRAAAIFATDEHQGRLAAVSCNLVHEGAHQVRDRSVLEEEMLCRTLELMYFRELQVGCVYVSRVTGVQSTAVFTSSTRYHNRLAQGLQQLHNGTLVDRVLTLGQSYRASLTNPRTASFIARSLNWWGGLQNRDAKTRGYYLRSLAAQDAEDADYALEILLILESLSAADWADASSCAGSVTRIRRALRLTDHGGETWRLGGTLQYGSDHARRIRIVQERLGEFFGVH